MHLCTKYEPYAEEIFAIAHEKLNAAKIGIVEPNVPQADGDVDNAINSNSVDDIRRCDLLLRMEPS